MKYAIIGFGFTGATLPLAHHLTNKNIDVDCYYLAMINSKSIESLNFDKPIKYSTTPIQISKTNSIYNYLNNNVRIKIIPIFKRRRKLEKFYIGRLINIVNKHICNKFLKQIISNNYDIINIIVHSEIDLYLCKLLHKHKQKIIITYHEVLSDLIKSCEIKKVVEKSLHLADYIILHSQKTSNDLINYTNKDLSKKINIINFGPFESYSSFNDNLNLVNTNNYILFFGSLHQYKGLDLLYSAVKLNKDLNNTQIVIAGNGNNNIIETLNNDKRFIVINRYIENNELVSLIKKCKFVICPYIAASQSGVVQTALGLNKYVLATNIGAFSEIIEEGENGFLCTPNNPIALSEKISYVLRMNKELDIPKIPDSYKWNNIIAKHIELIKQIQHKNGL